MEKDSFVSIGLCIAVLYLLFTFLELIIHKYIMHQVHDFPHLRDLGKNHIKHHLNTNDDDFTLKSESYANLCIDFSTFVIACLVGFSVLYALFRHSVSLYIMIGASALFATIQIVVWNSLHNFIHKMEPGNSCTKSFIPAFANKYIDANNPYVKWVITNHQAHHVFKGNEKGNWNVVFPGADYILGSHNKLPN